MAGVDTYQVGCRVLSRLEADIAAVDYLMEKSGRLPGECPHTGCRSYYAGRVRTSGRWSSTARRPRASATAALWSGFELTIRDEVTKAAEGRVALTALALWNFKVVREAAYTRAAIQIA